MNVGGRSKAGRRKPAVTGPEMSSERSNEAVCAEKLLFDLFHIAVGDAVLGVVAAGVAMFAIRNPNQKEQTLA